MAKHDSEYELCGVCDIFMAREPLLGKRFVEVTVKRTKKEWAMFIKNISDVYYKNADKITLVMDNLNTHFASSLYETFKPEKPKEFGIALSMAEIELKILHFQCLSRRIDNIEEIKRQVRHVKIIAIIETLKLTVNSQMITQELN